MEPTYTADQSSTNPPFNVTFGGIIDTLATTYERVVQARFNALNPTKNPPPGSSSYSPTHDTLPTVPNGSPSALPPSPSGAALKNNTGLLILGLIVALLFLFGRRGAA